MDARVAVGTIAVLAIFTLSGCLVPVQSADSLEEPTETDLSFADVASEVGFEYASSDGGAGNGNDGLYVADYDRDLREDVLAIGGSQPVLFTNTGDGFERSDALPNVSEQVDSIDRGNRTSRLEQSNDVSNVSESDSDAGRVQSALWFDHDADGWEDLLLFRRGETPVFLENDEGAFERRDVGFDEPFVNPVGASTADYDGDGCLDVFVAQYGLWSETTPEAWNDQFFDADNGEANALYRGTCGDGFERVEDAGIGPDGSGTHWSLATSFADLDGDGRPDIHVANDYYNDTVYYNQGDGTFEKQYLGAVTDRNGMSSVLADVTGDENVEIFVTNIDFDRSRIAELEPTHRKLFSNFLANRLGKRLAGNNLLVASENDTGYEDVGDDVGLAEGGWGWAAVVSDLDSDGDPDVFHGTQDAVRFDRDDPLYSFPMAWVHQDGQFYRQNASEIGLELTDDRGVVQFDYAVDGALDVATATYDGEYRLYRNDAPQGNSLQVVVDAGGAGGTAIGAELYATVDGETQYKLHNARADYQSQSSRVQHVGLGEAESVDELRIVWPDGTERTFEDVDGGQRIRVTPDGIRERLEYSR